MVSIRRASDEDNQALLDVEKMCPQGTGLVLLFDRSPDFFLRSKAYDNYSVYVAEEGAKIVGTISTTIKELNIDGRRTKSVYVYDMRVHPDYRGKGIASSLHQHALAEADDARLAYVIIMEENYPSIALIKKMGFQNIHDVLLLNIPLYERQTRTTHEIRSVTADDVPQVVDLINDYYRDRDFFSLLTETDFLDKTKRLPGYGLQNVQVIEEGNRIVACAGLWDYSEIFRVSALRVSAKLRVLRSFLKFISIFRETARLPSVGEPFRLMYVRDFAFIGKMDLVDELVRHCLCLANDRGCNFLSFALDPADPIIPLLAKYKPVRVTYHVYAKSLEQKALSSPTMMYIDAADL